VEENVLAFIVQVSPCGKLSKFPKGVQVLIFSAMNTLVYRRDFAVLIILELVGPI
jgi:hypothetical protein